MLAEYDSDERQLEAQSELESLKLPKIMQENDTPSLSVSLDRLFTRINSPTPQGHRQFRSEENKIRYLRSAVLHQKCAAPRLAISQLPNSLTTAS